MDQQDKAHYSPSKFSLTILNRIPFLRKPILRSIFNKNGLKLQNFQCHQNRFFIYQVDGIYIPNESLTAPFSYELQLAKAKNESMFEYVPKNGDTIIDIGAGLGEETLIFSKLVGEIGKVIAIEANPFVFDVLKKTIGLNHLHNVDAFNVAIADKEGKVSLSEMTGSYEEVFVKDQSSNGIIRAIQLGDLLKERNIQGIDLLKINIEGGEKAAIDHLTEEQFKQIRHMAIACHDFRWKKEGNVFFKTKEHISNLLLRNGFEISSRRTAIAYLDDWIYAKNKLTI